MNLPRWKSRSPSELVPGAGVWILPLLLLVSSAPACKPAPRYVLIDGGAHIGETVLAFEKSKLFAKHPWQVVSFEPNPVLVSQIPKRPYLTVLNQAIWHTDGIIDFQFSPQDTLGGSAMATVVPAPDMKSIKVPAVDLGRWLLQNYRGEDVVYLKLDIEGAEYPVLHKMLRDGSMTYVDKLYVEFHGVQQANAQKKPSAEVQEAQTENSRLIEAVSSLGVAVSVHFTTEEQGDYFNFDPESYISTP
jgi:FkbM family methyltransferase